jgi:hypothetical protein
MSPLCQQSRLFQIGVPKMITENGCPVCGYEMEAPPRDYRICPSCGTEFGVHDVNATIAELRDAWIRTGPKWWSKTDAQPTTWDPLKQMEDAGIAVKRPQAKESISVSTSTATSVVGSRDWKGWSAAPSGQHDGISPGVVLR